MPLSCPEQAGGTQRASAIRAETRSSNANRPILVNAGASLLSGVAGAPAGLCGIARRVVVFNASNLWQLLMRLNP
jgi:hypothetical protein